MPEEKLDIRYIAKLARLHVESGEAEKFEHEMQGIVAMVEHLPAFESGELPLDPEHPMRLRADEVEPSMPREVVLRNAPKTEAGCVVVPKTVE